MKPKTVHTASQLGQSSSKKFSGFKSRWPANQEVFSRDEASNDDSNWTIHISRYFTICFLNLAVFCSSWPSAVVSNSNLSTLAKQSNIRSSSVCKKIRATLCCETMIWLQHDTQNHPAKQQSSPTFSILLTGFELHKANYHFHTSDPYCTRHICRTECPTNTIPSQVKWNAIDSTDALPLITCNATMEFHFLIQVACACRRSHAKCVTSTFCRTSPKNFSSIKKCTELRNTTTAASTSLKWPAWS